MTVTFTINLTTQDNQISSRQFLIPDIGCINFVLNHFKILLNLPNVLLKLHEPKTVFLMIFCISYWVVKTSQAKTAIQHTTI